MGLPSLLGVRRASRRLHKVFAVVAACSLVVLLYAIPLREERVWVVTIATQQRLVYGDKQYSRKFKTGISGYQAENAKGNETAYKVPRWNERRIVKLIRSLVHPPLNKSSSEYEHDVCMISLVRNEYYLKEFLVRNILAGFQKIILLDDSWQPYDTNITNLVRPFIAAGVVERETKEQHQQQQQLAGGGGGPLSRTWASHFTWLRDRTEAHGKRCRWIMRLDSDEIVYPVGYPSERLPKWLAGLEEDYCEVHLNWLHPYSEGRSRRHGFAAGETLLSSYPRACFEHRLTKHLLQPALVRGIGESVHQNAHIGVKGGFGCKGDRTRLRWRPGGALASILGSDLEQGREGQNGGEDAGQRESGKRRGAGFQSPRPLLIHYYTKSLEDFLVKREQSMEPTWRLFKNYYDKPRRVCPLSKRRIPFVVEYIVDVERVMAVPFTEDPAEDRAGKTFARPLMSQEESGPVDDYELYTFVKTQIQSGKWFNQSCYYETYPDVKRDVERQRMIDATFHFVSRGFQKGRLKCWEVGPEIVT